MKMFNLLGEVVVKGNRPSYKLTAEGLQTHVQGTVLSKMGTAEDVLKHIPGLQKKMMRMRYLEREPDNLCEWKIAA